DFAVHSPTNRAARRHCAAAAERLLARKGREGRTCASRGGDLRVPESLEAGVQLSRRRDASMSRMQLVSRLVLIAVPGIAVLSFTTAVRGEPSAPSATEGDQACMTAFKSAQERERSGRLVEASQLFFSCEAETCGMALWEECAASATRL